MCGSCGVDGARAVLVSRADHFHAEKRLLRCRACRLSVSPRGCRVRRVLPAEAAKSVLRSSCSTSGSALIALALTAGWRRYVGQRYPDLR